MKKIGQVTLKSSDLKLEAGFHWAKKQAMEYVHSGKAGAGLWYEAALPGRNAFCMRDVSHQADGAAVLGLEDHTENMLHMFAENISESRDYCTYWEMTGEGLPCPDDYTDDKDFWYNHPGSFEVIRTCWRQHLWTEKKSYIEDPVFLKYYETVCGPYVERWDLDRDGIIEHYPEQGRRGISSYNEVDIAVKAAGDMVASQYAGYRSAKKLLTKAGKSEQANRIGQQELEMKQKYLNAWYCAQKDGFYSSMYRDGRYQADYALESSFLPLEFGILDRNEKMQCSVSEMLQHEPANVEGRSYYPQILYRCGRDKEAYQYLLSLAQEDLYRREYPEVSYAFIGAVTKGLLGINPEDGERIRTCSHIIGEEWVEMSDIPIIGTRIHIRQESQKKTMLSNCGEKAIIWKACFLGEKKEVLWNGEKIKAQHETDTAGRIYSYIEIRLDGNTQAEVEIEQ